MMLRTLARPALLLAALLLALLAVAACDDDEEDGANVPELADGTLTIGSDIAYAPIEFYEEGTETPTGLDVDIANAIGEELGVEVEFVNSGFDGLIPALNTDEFDAVMSAMSTTEERKQLVDFVNYANVGTGMLVPAGNPKDIQTIDDLCGLTVTVQLGTTQETLIRGQSDECDEAIDVVTFDTNPLAVEDLRTGGADANISDYPAAYLDAQESDGELEVVETQVAPVPYGIALRKDSNELEAVLQQALEVVMASGDYDEILAKWELESTALE